MTEEFLDPEHSATHCIMLRLHTLCLMISIKGGT